MPDYLIKYLWISNLVFISICSYLAADSVGTIIAGQLYTPPQTHNSNQPSKRNRQGNNLNKNFDTLSNRNLLAAKIEQLEPVDETEQNTDDAQTDEHGLPQIPPDDQLEECTLPGKLIATIEAENPQWSIAVYTPSGENQPEVYAMLPMKNSIEDSYTLLSIRDRSIVVKHEEEFELCELGVEYKKSNHRNHKKRNNRNPKKSESNNLGESIQKIDDTHYEVDKEEVDRVLGNLSTVATQARIVPYFKNGKTQGFKVFSIRPNSIFKKLGLRNGDIIHKVNGYEMDSPDKALEIYQKLRNSTSLNVDMTRRGKSRNVSVSIK